jgi:diguanylate cyclase (GGDEF)-like protein
MGAAAGLSAHQWTAKSGEVVQRQIGRLILTIVNAVEVEPRVLAEIHMLVSASAARVSLDAWRGQAETDELTRLRNSYGLQSDLEEATKRGLPLRVGFIDLDGLKQVNTEQGHDAGNRLIQQFGERLREFVHEQGGTAYRPHGDEFIAVLGTEQGHLDDALEALQETREFAFSWGVAEWPTDDEDIQTVQRLADQAMYEMKDAHKAAAAAADSETGGGGAGDDGTAQDPTD